MFTLIPTEPAERAVRLRRQLMAFYSYILLWFGTMIGVEFAAFSPDTPHIHLFGIALSANALFYIAIRTGLTENLTDPSLTRLQMLVGIAMATVILHYSRELRGAMLCIYFMAMTFGVFALDRRQLIQMALTIQAAFTALQIYEWQHMPQAGIFGYIFGHWVILALGLSWFVYVGGYIHNLQKRVRDQRESLREAHDHLAAIAVRDELTGLYNRRYIMERLEEELSRSDRQQSPFYLALIDLDHFKRINDQFGHQAGDEVLQRFAQVATDNLRRSDVVARYGGEEFMLLFSQTEASACLAALERLRAAFAEQRYDFGPDRTVTLSCGLASHEHPESAQELIQRADQALYEAKASGRDRIMPAWAEASHA